MTTVVLNVAAAASMPRASSGQTTGGVSSSSSAQTGPTGSVTATPGAVQADGPQARADALKMRGDDAMDSLHYDDAIAAYQQAYALSSNPALLYNLGQVFRARGQYPDALEQLGRFEREASSDLKLRVPALAALLAEVRGKVALLSITANITGARVLVRNQVVGGTPMSAPLKLNAGAAAIDVVADGYFPFHVDANLPGGATTVVAAVLQQKATSGVLSVKTNAGGGGGAVFVDGKSVGRAPLEIVVSAGPHDIIVRREAFEDTQTSAVVVAGQRRDVEVDLDRKPPITSKWWFWTGVGVAVLGGVAVTYALLTEKKAGTGDQFQPGQVSGPLLHW